MKNLAIPFFLTLMCIGCVSNPAGQQRTAERLNDVESANRIAVDLVSILNQLRPAAKTTVQYIASDHLAAQRVVERLRSTGYGLQKVQDDRGANFLTVVETAEYGGNNNRQHTLSVQVGDVSVERTYKTDADAGIYPTTPVVLRGSKAAVSVDQTLFDMPDSDIAFLAQVDYRESADSTIRVPKVTIITGELVSEIAANSTPLPNETGFNASNLETQNVFFTNESNFTDLTRGLRQVRRDIIVFDNDSLRLGNVGKEVIRTILDNYNRDTDIISLLGCSNGYTVLDIGNEGLALGRSKRVLDEFISLGVPRSSIYDEGCWAPESVSRYPTRGVVVELKRRKL